MVVTRQKNEIAVLHTGHLVTIGSGRHVLLSCDVFETNCMDELFDLVETEFAVVVEEYVAILNGQIRVFGDVPHFLQVLVVKHKQCIPGKHKIYAKLYQHIFINIISICTH